MNPADPVTPADCDDLVALFAYDEVGSRLVAALKFHNDRSCLRWAGEQLGAIAEFPADNLVVTWVPTTSRRRRVRGYDQAELLARHTALALRATCRSLLLRRDGEAQTGKDLVQRQELAPKFIPSRLAAGRDVLLVDDVCTTGTTLNAAAQSMRRAGAISVRAAVMAYTPKRV
ncbi:MAG: ComF family protein [Acidimicrobiales bacterium]